MDYSGVHGAFHVGAVAALFFFTWKALFVAMFLWWVSGSLGIGMSYHRLLTHRGYKTSEVGGVFPDRMCDAGAGRRPDFLGRDAPHSSSLFRSGRRSAFADRWQMVVTHGMDSHGQVDAPRHNDLARYVPDLAKDKFHVWMTKYHYVPHVVLGVALFAIGGCRFCCGGFSCA